MATEEDQVSPIRKNWLGIAITAVVLACLVLFIFKVLRGGNSAPRRAPELVMIKLPPPPPPTPPQQPTPEEKIVDEQEQKIETPDEKPPDEPPKPPDEPPIGTNIKGDGRGDSFGLSGSGGNGFGRGGGGSPYDWYAGQVQRRIADALRNNRETREANLSVKVRVWADNSGRISRAELAGSTGDAALDETLRSQILTGLTLTDGPPQGMPMPILLRLTARRPQ